MELLNLAKRGNDENYSQSRALVSEATAELERVRDMVNRLSARKIKVQEPEFGSLLAIKYTIKIFCAICPISTKK